VVSTVSQCWSSIASGWSRSLFPVDFSYSPKAASKDWLKVGGLCQRLGDEDMVLVARVY